MTQPAPFTDDWAARARRSRFRYLWVVGIALYLAIIWYIGWRRIGQTLTSIDLRYLAATIALCASALWLRALKWRLMLGPRQNSTGLFFVSKAGGGLSPGRVGELAPLLLRKHRTPRIGAWIITDRLLEMAATLGLGLFGLLALQVPKGGIALTFAAAMAILVIAPFFILIQRRLFLWLASHFREGGFIHRVLMLFAAISDEIRTLGPRVPLASALTVLATCLDLLVGMMLYLAFGHKVAFALLAVMQCGHAVASAIPFTPNATGVPYLVAAGILHQVGGVPEGVLAAAVGVGIAIAAVTFWTSFLIGMADLRRHAPGGQAQANLFDFLASGDSLYDYEPEALRRLGALVADKGRVLDIGCGDGAIGQALDAPFTAAFDISPRCAVHAHGRGIAALVADARHTLPFADQTFDTVYAVDVLHHLHGHWETMLAEAARILRPGGALVIVEPDARHPFVRWTQSPHSLIRVAPFDNEPAIHASDLTSIVQRLGFEFTCTPIRIDGSQTQRSVFPLWQRLLKAPFVIALVWWHGNKPNKFAIVGRKAVNGE